MELKLFYLDLSGNVVRTYKGVYMGYKLIKGGDFEFEDDDFVDNTEVQIENKDKAATDSLNTNIFAEDTIMDFKRKIYNDIGIEIFAQHIFIKSNITKALLYNLVIDYNYPINYLSHLNEKEEIMGIKIDKKLFTQRNEIKIEAMDDIVSMQELYMRYKTLEFYLIDLNQVKTQINTSNTQSYNLILYYGYIVKFWPMLTYEIFMDWLNNIDLRSSYPDLYKQGANYNLEKEIISQKYEMINNKDKRISQYCIDIINEKCKKSSICIRNITLTIKSYNNNIKNIMMFKNIELSEKIPLIKIHTNYPNRYVLIKTLKGSNIYNEVRARISLNEIGSILFCYVIDNDQYIIKILSDGTYFINSVNIDNIDKHIAKVIKDINPFIKKLNDMKRKVLYGSPLPTARKSNLEIHSIDTDVMVRIKLKESYFGGLAEKFKKSKNAGIISDLTYKPANIEFYFNKGMSHTIEYIPQNGYAFMIDINAKQQRAEMQNSKEVLVKNRGYDLRLSLNDVSEIELIRIYHWFITQLHDIKPLDIKDMKESKNFLKISKMKDPDLYDLKKYGVNIVLSRIIQGDTQPMPYTPEEFEQLTKEEKEFSYKYWNMTTDSEMYYVCNKKYPYLGFITGKHPEGYCIPSCRKVPIKNVGKKKLIYDTCIKYHKYGEEEKLLKSRYIMSYGKSIPLGRISNIPSLLDRYIKYNTASEDLTIKIVGEPKITYHGKKYIIKNFWKTTKNNKIYDVKVKDLEYILRDKKWSYKISGEPDYSPMEVIENPKKSVYHYKKIIDAEMYPIILRRVEDNIRSKDFPDVKQSDFNEKELYDILDGLHRLSKAYLSGDDTIKVKFITDKQLQKSQKKKTGGDESIKVPNYYLYGVEQYINNIENVGLLNCVLFTLKMDIEQFIQEIDKDYSIKILPRNAQQYFGSVENMIKEMRSVFIDDNISYFEEWNELIMVLTYHILQCNIIILNDISTTGENIELKSIIDISNVKDLIPDMVDGKFKKYIILNQMKKTAMTYSEYYPICIITPYMFYKNGRINQRTYNQLDILMKILSNLIQQNLSNDKQVYIDISTIINWTRGRYNIKTLYVNNNNECYAVMFNYENKDLIIPLYNKKIDRYFHNNIKRSKRYHRTDCNYDKKTLMKFVRTFNDWAEGNNVYKISTDNTLVYNKKEIGFDYSGLYFYYKPIKNTSTENIMELKYDPDIKNEIIANIKYNDIKPHINGIESIKEKARNYHNYVMDFLGHLDKESNNKIRDQILSYIDDNFIDNMQDLQAYISHNLDKHDNITIQNMINQYFMMVISKQELIDEIKFTKFRFDNITLNKISEIVYHDDNYNMRDKSIRDIIKKINGKYNIKTSKDNITKLVNDFINPLKNKLLLNGIYNHIIEEKYQKDKNENIFIKLS